ncbi:MAG TPA: lysophospholipid acyltransferase family protein [Acidimicrobiales bacterium]|nr:lysophospholipid acyltransferase family protein [Acidimicrobiales bacterium]
MSLFALFAKNFARYPLRVAYWLLKLVLTPILRFFYRVRVEGAENVPRRGPVILAGNHISFSDSIFLPLVLRRRVTFVAKAEYFDDPKTAWFFRAVGQIPIRRTGGPASLRALETAKGVLADGGVFGIYPEGTRSPDGRLYRGHTGVARLALECQVPVVAVAMVGTREIQAIGQVRPKLFMPVTVRFSKPLTFDHLYDRASDPRVLRQATDEIMFALREMSGQEYVHKYAKRRDVVGAAEPSKPAAVPLETPGQAAVSAAVV